MTGPVQDNKAFLTQGIHMLKAMVGIATICAFFIALTFETTYDRIEANKARALNEAVFEVLPNITIKKSFHFDGTKFLAVLEGEKQDQQFHAGYDNEGNVIGVVVEASGMGYADIIKVLYAYDPEAQEIVGFKVLETKETPGLGDKIEKDASFLKNFEHLDVSLSEGETSLNNEVVTVKQGKKHKPWQIDGILSLIHI